MAGFFGVPIHNGLGLGLGVGLGGSSSSPVSGSEMITEAGVVMTDEAGTDMVIE